MPCIDGSIVGREVVAYFKEGTTWGTEESGGEGMLLQEDGIEISQDLDDVEESNSAFLKEQDLGVRTAAANIVQNMYFDDQRAIIMALGTGSYATPTEINSGKSDYQHVIFPHCDNFGQYATMGFQKGSFVDTLPSSKFTGFTMAGQSSPQRITITSASLANNLINDSAVITPSDFASLSIPTGPSGRAYFRQMTFRINDQNAATLTASDEIQSLIADYETSFNRNLTSDYTNNSGLDIEEPLEDVYPETLLNLTIRNKGATSDALFSDWKAKTPKKLELLFTGPAASTATGTVNAAIWKLEAPKAVIQTDEPGAYTGPGRIGSTVSFKFLATETTSDAPGMAFTQPFKLTVVNNQSSKMITT